MLGKIRDDVYEDLLVDFKRSIGDYSGENEIQDDYYIGMLKRAVNELLLEDISLERLTKTEAGKSLVVLYAETLMNKTDIATDQSINLLKIKLSLATKGDRYVQ